MTAKPSQAKPSQAKPSQIIPENFIKNKILALKAILPEVFCEEQIDWEKLKLVLGEDNLSSENERYQLNWAGKSAAYQTLQAPTSNTLAPCVAESVDFEGTQNLFIEAENLEALKILQKSYAGSVKMIYIDPPYNTGNDSFIYPDKFSENREEYARRVGDKDDEGYLNRDGVFQGAWRPNKRDNGHYHSNWLSMMLPRLHLAKTLLRDDGVIFISIDDNEQAQLKLLCDEVFGAENFVAQLIWRNGRTSAAHFTHEHENILCYTKHKDSLALFKYDGKSKITDRTIKKPSAKNPTSVIHFPAGIEFEGEDKIFPNFIGNKEPVVVTEGIFQCKDKKLAHPVALKAAWTMADMIKDWLDGNEIYDQKGQKISRFFFKSNGILQYEKEKGTLHPKTIISEFSTKQGTTTLTNLFKISPFEFPKPPSLISYLVKIVCPNSNDLILDFFSGTATTAHAVMQLNAEDGGSRRCISIQLPEATDEQSEAYKAGYLNIAEIAKERIRRAGRQIAAAHPDKNIDTGFKVFKLAESHFKQWQSDVASDGLEAQLNMFIDPVAANALPENMAYELLLRLGLKLTARVWQQNDVFWLEDEGRRTALLLTRVDEALLDELTAQQPDKVVALDRLFDGNDALKTNAVLQMKEADIVFATV